MDQEPEVTPEEKQKYIEELQKFTQDVDEQIKELCSFYGYDFDEINKYREPFMMCPFNSGHRVPERSMERHLAQCEWNTLGYTKDCKPLPESALPLQSQSTIKFDMELQHKVLQEAKRKNPELNISDEEKLIPMTSDRLMSDFTVDERRAMYDYVVANTIAPDSGKDVTDIENIEKKEERNTTILELLQQERNLKRRRAKYRGVHTNKKTHTEILREVVEQQMEMYKDYISAKYGIPDASDDKSCYSDSYSNDDKHKQKDDVVDWDKSSKFSSKHKSYDTSRDKSFKKHYDEDYNRYKHFSRYKDYDYENSSRVQDSRKYSGHRESRDKHQSRKRDRSDSRNNKERYSSYDRKRRSRSEESKLKKSKISEQRPDEESKDESNRLSRSRSRERKRDGERMRSKSRERKKDHDDRKSHKKHKKERKKKRDKSKDSYGGHKHSKHDHKRRSRSSS